MPLEPLKPDDGNGFPRAIRNLLNLVVGRVNRTFKFNFDTDSLNPIAKVLETERDITFIIPRGALASNSSQGPWALVPSGDNKVKVVGDAPLRYSEVLDDIVTIANIGDDFTPTVGKLLFLQIDYDVSLGITGVTLKMENPWATYSFPYVTSGSVLTFDLRVTTGYYLIGKCLSIDDTVGKTLEGPIVNGVKVARCCNAPLLFDWTNMGGGFIIPFPQPPSQPGPPA